MNITDKLHRTLNVIIKHKLIVIWLLILVLLGFTLWQTLRISNPSVDEEYLQDKRSELEESISTIELDPNLRAKIESLETIPVNTDPRNLGTNDPFNP